MSKKKEELMAEAELMRKLQLRFSLLGARVFRNNNGMGWTGKAETVRESGNVMVHPGDVVIRKARPLHAGLMPGSSDLIGYQSVIISPSMVGSRFALFTSPEIKRPTKSKEQQNQQDWINAIKEAGGQAGFVHTEEECDSLIGPPKV